MLRALVTRGTAGSSAILSAMIRRLRFTWNFQIVLSVLSNRQSMKLRNAITVACALAVVFPSAGAPPGMSENAERIQAGIGKITQFDVNDDDPLAAMAYEEADFTRRVNNLVTALNDFSHTYNAGHVVDVKKVRAVRKAWVELEKSGWFKTEEKR